MAKDEAIALKAPVKVRGRQRSEAMGQGPIWKLLLRFSGPAIVTQVVAGSYNMVDAVFVGRLGTAALAALAIAFPIMMIFVAIGIATGMGAASLISRYLGAGKPEEANKVAGGSMTLFVVLSGVLTAICLPNLETLLRLFGARGEVLTLATQYMRVEIGFTLINFFSLVLAELIRAEGNAMLSSGGMIASGLINCIMDPILGFGIGPFPRMGMAGFALATTVGRGIATTMFVVYLLSGKTSYQFKPNYFWPKLKTVVDIYRVGIASILRMTAGSVAMAVANATAVSFGVIPLAVRGVLFRASSLAFMPIMGLGQGVLPLVGYNYGARKNERVGEVVIKAGLVSFAWGALCWVVVMLFATPIMSIFNTDPQFLAIGTQAFRIFASGFFIVGTQMVLSFFFQGTGRGLASSVTASSRQVIFLIPGLFIFPKLFGLIGLWIVFPVADFLSVILTLVWASIEFQRLGIPFRLRYNQIQLNKD